MALKKKAILASTLVVMIVLVVVFIVLLRVDIALLSLFQAGADKSTCTWTAVMNAISKTAGKEQISVVCPQKHVKIADTKKDLKDFDLKDTKTYYIDREPIKKERKDLEKWYNAYEKQMTGEEPYTDSMWEKDRDGKKVLYKVHRLNEALGKELKICWSQLGRGKLDLFGQWFDVWAKKKEQSWFTTYFKPWENVELTASACIICSRVEVVISDSKYINDKKLKDVLREKLAEDPLAEWLKKNPVMDFKSEAPLSYYEFLLDEGITSDFFRQGGDEIRYGFDLDKEYAVVFMRERALWPAEFMGIKSVDTVRLMPYLEVKDSCEIMN